MENNAEYYFFGKDTTEVLIAMSKNLKDDIIQKRGDEVLKELKEEFTKRINEIK